MGKRWINTVGWVLVSVALVLMCWSTYRMVSTFNSITPGSDAVSSSELATEISAALIPMVFGGPAFVVGLIVLLVGWWRS